MILFGGIKISGNKDMTNMTGEGGPEIIPFDSAIDGAKPVNNVIDMTGKPIEESDFAPLMEDEAESKRMADEWAAKIGSGALKALEDRTDFIIPFDKLAKLDTPTELDDSGNCQSCGQPVAEGKKICDCGQKIKVENKTSLNRAA